MNLEVSVIICTHNPRPDYLRRVLDALQAQTLAKEQWELLLIDNASTESLAKRVDLSWHPNGKILEEKKLGKIHALHSGIQAARAELLVTLDDDNVPSYTYLETVLTIGNQYPFLGAWGGQIVLEFEGDAPEWTKEYWWCLAYRKFNTDCWANLPYLNESTPCGVGMCLRSTVARKFVEVSQEPLRQMLGRFGKGFGGSEDSDLALTACDMQLGTGYFSALSLVHLVPASRLQENYLLKLYEGIAYSAIILKAVRRQLPKRKKWRATFLDSLIALGQPARTRRFRSAALRGEARAFRLIQKTSAMPTP